MKKQVFNPYLPIDEHVPDGEPHIFGDRLYIFGSHDRGGGETYCELDYVGYSAPVDDLTDWRYEGVIYSAAKDPHSAEVIEGAGPRKYLYAPDVVQGNDGKYYLYYCLSAWRGKGGFDGPISVAVCDTPVGEYEYLGDVQYKDGSPMKRFIPFDPAVINDNGTIYLYYGWALSHRYTNEPEADLRKRMKNMFHKSDEELDRDGIQMMGANVAVLKEDMLTVKDEPQRIIPCHRLAQGTEFEEHAFFEASSIRKVGDKYYFIYSTQVQHELAYAVSKYPDREFHFGGVIISNGDIGYQERKPENRLANTGTNHGSIICVNHQWYVFYHKNTHLSSYSRQGAAEKITIEKDGTIRQVEMTSCGLNNGPLVTEGSYPAVIACNLTDGNMPHNGNCDSDAVKPVITHLDKEYFISNIHDATLIGYKYFDFNKRCRLTVTYRGAVKGVLFVTTELTAAEKLMIVNEQQFAAGHHDSTVYKIALTASKQWKCCAVDMNAIGVCPLFFIFKGEGTMDLLQFEFASL